MYCTNCGAEVSPKDKFCMKCGAPVNPADVNIVKAEETAAESAAETAAGETAVPEAATPEMTAGETAAPEMTDGEATAPETAVPEMVAGETAVPENTDGEAAAPAPSSAESAAPAPGPAASDQPVGYQPQYGPMTKQPKQNKVWPVVVAILAFLLLVSIGIGVLVKKAVDHFTADIRDSFDVDDSIEEFMDDYDDSDDFDSSEDFDDWDSDWDEIFGEDMEEFEDYFDEYSDFGDTRYEYATVTYMDEFVCLSANNVIKDSTVLYGGRTIGDFCDYVDSEVLDGSIKLNRKAFYQLLELHLVDPSLIEDNTEYFEQSMMYCLAFTKEFGDGISEIPFCMYSTEEPNTFYYNLEVYDKDDTWMVDYSEEVVYMNGGDTEYKSAGEYSMFSEKALSIWLDAIDEFFGIE